MSRKTKMTSIGLGLLLLFMISFQNCSNGGPLVNADLNQMTSQLSVNGGQPPPLQELPDLLPEPVPPGAPEPTPQPSATPQSNACRQPEVRSFTLSDSALKCGSVQEIARFTIQERGFALARAAFTLESGAASSNQAGIMQVLVGEPELAPTAINSVCRNSETGVRRLYGYGRISDASQTIRIMAAADPMSTACTNDVVRITNARVDVWIEDERPACQKKDIVALSTVNTLNERRVINSVAQPTLELKDIPRPPVRDTVVVVSHLDATVGAYPGYGCGGTPGLVELSTSLNLNGVDVDPANSSSRQSFSIMVDGVNYGAGRAHAGTLRTFAFNSEMVTLKQSASALSNYPAMGDGFGLIGRTPGVGQYGDAFLGLIFMKR